MLYTDVYIINIPSYVHNFRSQLTVTVFLDTYYIIVLYNVYYIYIYIYVYVCLRP